MLPSALLRIPLLRLLTPRLVLPGLRLRIPLPHSILLRIPLLSSALLRIFLLRLPTPLLVLPLLRLRGYRLSAILAKTRPVRQLPETMFTVHSSPRRADRPDTPFL